MSGKEEGIRFMPDQWTGSPSIAQPPSRNRWDTYTPGATDPDFRIWDCTTPCLISVFCHTTHANPRRISESRSTFADHFPSILHNHLQGLLLRKSVPVLAVVHNPLRWNHAQVDALQLVQYRPDKPLTLLRRIFCSQLLCLEYFAAHHPLQVIETM
jgi:hypothetical protein